MYVISIIYCSYCNNEEHFFINIVQPAYAQKPISSVPGIALADMRGDQYFKRLGKVVCAHYFWYLDLHLQPPPGHDKWCADDWKCSDKPPLLKDADPTADTDATVDAGGIDSSESLDSAPKTTKAKGKGKAKARNVSASSSTTSNRSSKQKAKKGK
jgi:hypothetical protein